MAEQELKQCKKCKEHKPLECFSKLKQGKQPDCKACNKAANAKFRAENPKYRQLYLQTETGKQAATKANKHQHTKWGSGVYAVINKQTGKMYIGSTAYLHKRKCEHLKQFGKYNQSTSHQLYLDIIELGVKAFKFEILETVDLDVVSRLDLFKLELKYIKQFDAKGIELYNVTGTSKKYKK